MSTPANGTMTPAEEVVFAEMVERMRQLRRHRGVPNGVSLEDAISLHMISAGEVERARWGDAPLASVQMDAASS